jgi:chloramphenicol 3-O phosphotransferase
MQPGHVLFLNGTSSAGKTSIALALQEILDQPYVYLSVDTFILSIPMRFLTDPEVAPQAVYQAIRGFHHTIHAFAQTGNRVLVDHVLQEPEWRDECMALLADIPTTWIGVHCTLEELERREQQRGDREIGLAHYQYTQVHVGMVYDLEVDTLTTSATDCALAIKRVPASR